MMKWKNMEKGDVKVIWICISLAMANVFSGYDTASVAAVISDLRFIDQWKFSSAMSGAFAVLINVGNILAYMGPLIFLNRRFGRKVTMTVGTFTLMTGAALVAGARNEGMLLFGRVLCGLGVSLNQGSFAGWAAELASARSRGAAVTIVQCSYQLGVFLAFWISLGTVKIPGTNAWRTLVAIQMIFGILLLIATAWAPESPRMLLLLAKDPSDDTDDKVVKAKQNLCKIRLIDEDDPRLQQEWSEIRAASVLQRLEREKFHIVPLLRRKATWKRIAIGAGSCIFAQLTGVAALMLYGITVFESLGLGGQDLSLITNGLSGSLQLVACFFPVLFVDRIGRRKVMLIGLAITCIGYVFLGALFERWPNASNKSAGVWLVICIFAIQCAYAGALGSVCILIGTEIWPQPLREFGISVSLFGLFFAVIVVNQLWPVLTDAISFRLYWIMLAINLITFSLVYAFWPETKGLSLDAMDKLFGDLEVDVTEQIAVSAMQETYSAQQDIETQLDSKEKKRTSDILITDSYDSK